jgi:sec-independent protein translocase protein TatC
MNFWDHLIELRERIVKAAAAIGVGMAVSFFGLERMAFHAALLPLGDQKLQYLGIAEAFTTHLLFALWLGVILALPIVAYQAWAFVAPGLFPKEKKVVVVLALASTALFLAGAAFGYFVLMPVVIEFFLSFQEANLVYGGALEPYLKTFTGILLGTGVAFQLPIILIGLMKAGILERATLAAQRPYWILFIVVAAAVLTPTGDIVTQLLLAVPMWILFEGALLAARVFRI